MKIGRRKFLQAGAGSLALLAAGCDQMPRELTALLGPQARPNGPFQPPASEAIDPMVHTLNRLSFGARPGDYERVKKLGADADEAIQAHLEQQLNPDSIEDGIAEYAVRRFETLAEPVGEMYEYQDDLLHNELMRGTLARAI
jgi:hypothetical protein